MSAITEAYIFEIISKIADQHNIKEFRHSIQNFESIAQNYFGVLIPVVLSGKMYEKPVDIALVLKLVPPDDRFRVSGAVTLMFAREIFVYEKLFDIYHTLQEHNLTDQFIMPKCYYVCREYGKEVIVMQDMRELGYKPVTDTRFLDFNHIFVSLQSLAKLHALSFILKDKHSEKYAEIATICTPLTENTNKRFMDILVDRLGKVLVTFDNSSYVPLLTKLKENHVKYVEAAVTSVTASCICHGDIWKENILFQYEDVKPISACLIDYQTARISSPAYDVLYLIITSTDTTLRQNYFNKLLDEYYQTFAKFLCSSGYDTNVVYSRQMFDEDLKTVGPACLIVANTAFWLSSNLQEEGHVRSKHIWSTPEEKLKAVNRYRMIIKGIIDDFCNYGYLSL